MARKALGRTRTKTSTRRCAPVQRVLSFGRGGWRPGAGRKPSRNRRRRAPHRARLPLSRHHPVHVVLRVRRDVRNLRTKKRHQAIRQAFVDACSSNRATKRNDFRVIDWSIQGNHLHLIVEASDQPSLSRGMQGLTVRLARAINRAAGRRGTVFAERYYAHVLRTPREVRSARCYVVNNSRRHTREASEDASGKWVDPYSSWAWFDGWHDLPSKWLHKARAGPEAVAPVADAETWLLRIGWRRHGLVRLTENPGGGGRRIKPSRAGEGR